jgi:ubiquinone/menaquinone biosynthesis C-methylase UbiE
MPLYDFLAPAYDPAFAAIYRPFRTRALKHLPSIAGASVLDLACGTGQNFPLLAGRGGAQGKIIGVDISSGMLRHARRRVERTGLGNVSLVHLDAACLTPAAFEEKTGFFAVDVVVCTYGFTAMRGWEKGFRASWNLLKPGGCYLIHDIDGGEGSFHSFAVELVTRCNFSNRVWKPLQTAASDFRMDYIEPSAHLFGGRLFVAYGTKPPAAMRPISCLF